MRISDWSSDVCSSDLLPLYGFDPADLTFDRTRRPPGQNGAFHGIDVAGDAGRKAAKFPVHCLFEPFVELGHFVAVEQRDEPHGLLSHRAKFRCLRIEMVEEPGDFGIDLIGSLDQIPGIGRASCRKRVCKYVMMSVGAL